MGHMLQKQCEIACLLRKFVNKVRETGLLCDNKKTLTRVRIARSMENINAVAESVHENPST